MLAHAAIAEFVHLGNEAVEKIAVVTHQNKRAVKIAQSLFEYILSL